MFEKLKMTEALIESGRNCGPDAGGFRHCFISPSRPGRGSVCSLAGEETCHTLTHHSGP